MSSTSSTSDFEYSTSSTSTVRKSSNYQSLVDEALRNEVRIVLIQENLENYTGSLNGSQDISNSTIQTFDDSAIHLAQADDVDEQVQVKTEYSSTENEFEYFDYQPNLDLASQMPPVEQTKYFENLIETMRVKVSNTQKLLQETTAARWDLLHDVAKNVKRKSKIEILLNSVKKDRTAIRQRVLNHNISELKITEERKIQPVIGQTIKLAKANFSRIKTVVQYSDCVTETEPEKFEEAMKLLEPVPSPQKVVHHSPQKVDSRIEDTANVDLDLNSYVKTKRQSPRNSKKDVDTTKSVAPKLDKSKANKRMSSIDFVDDDDTRDTPAKSPKLDAAAKKQKSSVEPKGEGKSKNLSKKNVKPKQRSQSLPKPSSITKKAKPKEDNSFREVIYLVCGANELVTLD